jgi:hypothetical protein
LTVEDVEEAINFAAQSFEPSEDYSLMEQLLESSAEFQALVAKSKADPRKPFRVAESAK